MLQNRQLFGIPLGPAGLAVTLVLLGQITFFYGWSRTEYVPEHKPLSEFPHHVGEWRMARESVLDEEIQAVLKADDTLTRIYVSDSHGREANLYIAYFGSQRAGVTPHSPKVCLPGSGWVPEESSVVSISVDQSGESIPVNRYIVSRADYRQLVFYWYQSPKRAVANEFRAKLYLTLDSLRYNRSDTSLVRVLVPVIDGDEEGAEAVAIDFIQEFYRVVRDYLPS